MVDIKSFPAIRPKNNLADQVASHPYDVVSRQEAKELTKNNPYSFLHIDRSEVDLEDSVDAYDKEVYQKAKDNLSEFLKKDWLVKDHEPYLYIYQLKMGENSQTGLVTTTSVQDYIDKKIKKHEFTRVEKEIDRINHIDTTDANTSPIFLAYEDEDHANKLINQWTENQDPIYDFTSFYEVEHKVWVIDNQEVVQELVKTFEENVPVLYIADGHHRAESAVKVAKKRRDDGNISEEGEYFLSVLFPKSQLNIYDYNRLVQAPLPDNFVEKLSDDFTVTEISNDDRRPQEKNQLTMYLGNQWYLLEARDHLIKGHVVDDLDASLLQDHVFNKYFGIEDPRTDDRLTFVGGIKGLDTLEESVNEGESNLAFALYPTAMDDLFKVADLGETMPPKSTWFEPKLLSGLFIHDLESK